MPFVMTKLDEVVDVEIETEFGSFTLKVGAIPAVIGQKIDELQIKCLSVLRAIKTGQNIEQASLESQQNSKEINRLLIEYGVRGQTGLEDSEGKPIPFVLEKEAETGFMKLSKETLDIFVSNDSFMGITQGPLMKLRKIGLGRYKVQMEKGVDLLKVEDAQEVPLTSELQDLFSSSTTSTEENETP